MQLRVFADEIGEFHLEVSSPALVYKRHLFVPMLPSSAPILAGVDSKSLVPVSYAGTLFSVPYLLVHSEEARLTAWNVVGSIDESDSRNVLNHILDILAWD
jgi:hypothetical protein